MRACDYCGKENADASSVCAACGGSLEKLKTSFPIPWTPLVSWGGLMFGIFNNVWVVDGCLPVFFRHNNLGPMTIFWFISLFYVAIVGFVIGIPCGILAIKKRRPRVGWLGVVLAPTPAPLGWTVLKVAMHINGLEFD